MFNLIPHTLKERIIKDYKGRRVTVVFFGVVCLIVILFIFISPTYGYLFFEEQNVIAEAETMKKSDQFQKADQVVAAIKETNEQLRALSLDVRSVQPIQAVERVVQAKNTSIHITDIQYKEVTATSSILILQGKADRRDSLKQFITNLQSISGFSDVTLPVSNFAKDKDIDFSVSMKML